MQPFPIDRNIINHTIPVLIATGDEKIEILLAFVATNDISIVPDYAADAAVELSPEDEIAWVGGPNPDHKRIGSIWILPAIVRARRLIGPIEENIPGGDGGEVINPVELVELLNHIDILDVLADLRDNLIDDSSSLSEIIRRII